MTHLFLDTNVVLDFLTDRKPFSNEAARIFMAAEDGSARLYVSAISFNNLYYVIRQTEGHKKAMELIELLDTLVLTVDLNSTIIRKGFRTAGRDFEDAIQLHSARSQKKIQAIVTRNEKDFKNRDLVILSPASAVKLLDAIE